MNILNLQETSKIFKKMLNCFFIFLTIPDEVEEYVENMQSNSLNNCIHHYNVEILNFF